ncbi:MAG: putative baseplate assembly protein [Candidatus Tectimicrobiota bacterium]
MAIPIPQLDDKPFAALLEEARLLIPRYAPTWTDHNVHDPGITLIELFAWLAETQMYTLDQITPRHIGKYLRLLHASPRAATPATAWVACRLPAGLVEPLLLPRGTQLLGGRPGTDEALIFETVQEAHLVPTQLVAIERSDSRGRVDVTAAYERGPYIYAFGGESGTPIEPGSALWFGFERPLPLGPFSLALSLYEADLLVPLGAHAGESPEVMPSSAVQWEYWAEVDGRARWVALAALVDETLVWTWSGLVHGTIQHPMLPHASLTRARELCWLRCRTTRPAFEMPPRLQTLALNAVTVREGYTVPLTVIGSGTGTPSQRLALGQAPVVAASVQLEVYEALADAWVPWTPVADFDASEPTARHVVLDPAQGCITFGDGVQGRMLPGGHDNVRATYRVGGGRRGNLAAGSIRRFVSPELAALTVTNPQPASGGADPETLADAWVRARTEFSTPSRAVTEGDCETLALATPGLRVARARALAGFDPERPDTPADCWLTVVVVPYSLLPRPLPSGGFLETVRRHLDRHRLITTVLRVIAPVYVEVAVTAEVTVKPRYAPLEVRQRIVKALEAFLDPLHGGAEQTGWPFGRSVYRSELAYLIERLDGVACLQRLILQASGGSVRSDGDVEIPPIALVYPGQLRIEAEESTPVCEVQPCPSPVQ